MESRGECFESADRHKRGSSSRHVRAGARVPRRRTNSAPHPRRDQKTTVCIIIIIFPRGWSITSLPFAAAAAIYAARGRIGHAVAARSAAPIGTAAVVIIIVGHVSLLYLLPGR